MRDSDRAKVYAAEQEVRRMLAVPGFIKMYGTLVPVPDERKFGAVADVQVYVDRVLQHIGHDTPITVRTRKGHKAATYSAMKQEIAIPDSDRWALREVVVLHEVAHHLSRGSDQSHGPEFRSAFCNLLESVLAPEARFLLQVAFFERGLTA